MAHAQTIAIARGLLRSGQARDVSKMLSPLCEEASALRGESVLLRALLTRANLVLNHKQETRPNQWAADVRQLPEPIRDEVTLWDCWSRLWQNPSRSEARSILARLAFNDLHRTPELLLWRLLARAEAYLVLDEQALVLQETRAAETLNNFWQDSVAAKRIQMLLDALGKHDMPISKASISCFTGYSETTQSLVAQISSIRQTCCPVFIQGPAGAGKRTLAQCLHEQGPLIEYTAPLTNPEGAISELLGNDEQPGIFAQAEGGTLILPGLDHFPTEAQQALLDLLQQHDSTGGTPFRLIVLCTSSATSLVQSGRLIPKLGDWLSTIHLQLPALAHRKADILLLADEFLQDLKPDGAPFAAFTDNAMRALMHYPWPGNVRQLRNEIERALLYAGNDPYPVVRRRDLSTGFWEIDFDQTMAEESAVSLDDILSLTERKVIEQALRAHAGQVSATAEALNVTRQGLYKKMKRLGIDAADFHSAAKPAVPSTIVYANA